MADCNHIEHDRLMAPQLEIVQGIVVCMLCDQVLAPSSELARDAIEKRDRLMAAIDALH